MSRGLRNNNPGNIRHDGVLWRGEVRPSSDPAFKQFSSPAWGYRAMFVILDTYRRKHGIRTLQSVIARYAPPSENDTAAYLRFVADRAGTDPAAPLDFDNKRLMCDIVGAMSRVENGMEAIEDDLTEGWKLFIDNR